MKTEWYSNSETLILYIFNILNLSLTLSKSEKPWNFHVSLTQLLQEHVYKFVYNYECKIFWSYPVSISTYHSNRMHFQFHFKKKYFSLYFSFFFFSFFKNRELHEQG